LERRRRFINSTKNTGKTKYLFAVASDLVNWSLSPDGTTLAIIENGSNERTIQLRSMSSGKTRLLRVKGWPRIETVDWAYDAKNLFVVTSASAGKSSLLKVTLDGHAKKLREIEDHIIHWAIPSPNGHLLAIYESVSVSNAWALESGLNKRQ
jgi:hypothetical protein